MREIKFRAWNKDNDEMVYSFDYPYHWNIGDLGLELLESDGTDYVRQEAVFMQFTGLLDKNGTGIYEGDIVTSASPELIFQVVYKAPSFCRKWIDDASKRHHDPIEPMAWNTHIICEIIGNIYEHPHLLSGDSP